MSAELVVVLGRVAGPSLRGAERVALASARAREALQASARRVGAELGALEKDEHDAPLPSLGWHWSIAHAGGRVAGVVARQRVGVDLEPLRRPRAELLAAVLAPEELQLLGADEGSAFLRGWTAKEAVLKKLGVGLRELSQCRIVAAPSAGVLELEHAGRLHRVHQHLLEDAVCAVSVDGPQRRVSWIEEHAA